MAATINIHVYSDALVVLGTAGVVVPMVLRCGLSPVIGYLSAGALLGPLGLGKLVTSFPLLYWFTISDVANVAGIAELGIVFLFFLIGIELSFARLKTMRRLVFGFGSAQIIASTAVLALAAYAANLPAASAIVIGACLALSSTAIVVELLSSQGRMTSTAGRASFSILLAQDLAVIPLLFLISVMGTRTDGSVLGGLVLALAQAGTALGAILLFGRYLLRPIFRLVASSGSNELFIAATLFVIVLTGVVAALAGMSMALGAFVAGLMLAETEYRKAIEALIEPFKGLLLGIFFFTVGMSIDIREILREPLWFVAAVLGLIGVKALILFALARLFRIPTFAALEAAMLLAPGGEFAFVGIGLALALGVIVAPTASFFLTVTAVSMALIPALGALAQGLKKRLTPPGQGDGRAFAQPEAQSGHAIVVGHGRVGKVVCEMLARHKHGYTATDSDAIAVGKDRRAGHKVYFGNATHLAFLEACGLKDASAVIITIHTPEAIDAVVRLVRAQRADIPIISRARDASHARHLYAIGVTDAAPETIEASLQLSEAALVNLNVPMGKVIASIHEKRDEFRAELVSAVAQAGLGSTNGIRAKTSS